MLDKASSPFSISVSILKCISMQNLIKVYHVVKDLKIKDKDKDKKVKPHLRFTYQCLDNV